MEGVEINKSTKEEVEVRSKLGLQDYLSLGYIYLLVLGVFHETIYYKYLDINILEYSSVLDVLISPISVITGNLWLCVALIFAVGFAYLYKVFLPKYYRYLGKKKKYQSGKNKIKIDKTLKGLESSAFTIFIISLMIFSVFTGMGIGSGIKLKQRINKDEIKYTHELIFEDNKTEKIKMLGKNSLYVFYITKGKGEVYISPIDGNIKIIKKLKKVEDK